MATSEIGRLDRQFRIGEQVCVADRGGSAIVTISTPACHAEIALQGAQVLSWRPNGQADVLWCSPISPAGTGKPIRGGVPVCWPWFGPHPTDSSQPQHGLVRIPDWRLRETAVTSAGVRIAFAHETFDCALSLTALLGARLTICLAARNLGDASMLITEALHTYFHVGDNACVAIHGLDGCRYRDNTDSGREKLQHGPCSTAREIIALFDVTPDHCEIEDPRFGRRIRVERQGGQSTIVWHPGASAGTFKDIPPGGEKNFVCVESGNIGASAITLEPGGTHRLQVSYEVAAL